MYSVYKAFSFILMAPFCIMVAFRRYFYVPILEMATTVYRKVYYLELYQEKKSLRLVAN